MIARRTIRIVTERPQEHRQLRAALAGAGFQVTVGRNAAGTPPPDLVLIDLTSERLWSVAERLTGVRRLCLVQGAGDIGRAFALGAEDCVVAGAHQDEVTARCEAVLRRTSREPALRPDVSVYVDRRLWINFDSRQVWVSGSPVHLTPREFRLLRFLIQHRDERLTHARILDAVWGRTLESERPTEVLKQYIWRLRQKLEEDPNEPATIVTDSGEGYRFIAHPA